MGSVQQRTGLGTRPGLHQVYPPTHERDETVIDIIAIHGLDTSSPRTWEYGRNGGSVNWLCDPNMLPSSVPQARIYTYDWDANCFKDAPVQNLFGHADTLLARVSEARSSPTRPIIFIASCFGGLVLAEAMNRADRSGSEYGPIIRYTVGAIFLATPFHGSDAATPARWLTVVKGIMGDQASDSLIKDLEKRNDYVWERVQAFSTLANRDSFRLPVTCFYETQKTELLTKLMSRNIAKRLSSKYTKVTLVSKSSACPTGFTHKGLAASHVLMNKFSGPESENFLSVKADLCKMVDNAESVLQRRQSHCLSSSSDSTQNPRSPRQSSQKQPSSHFSVPFGRNSNFVGRDLHMDNLVSLIRPSAVSQSCQRVAVKGLGGIGKTQIALEAAYRLREEDANIAIFWVPAVNSTMLENGFRQIGRLLGLAGMDDDKTDFKAAVNDALSQPSAGPWVFILDNADDPTLLHGPDKGQDLSGLLPRNDKGSVLVTTRSHKVVTLLDISPPNVIALENMSPAEAILLLNRGLNQKQAEDIESASELLEFLAYLPLAIKQASAYMYETDMATSKYLKYCRESDNRSVQLLSKDFEDQGRYRDTKNPIATTWLITFERIVMLNPTAADLLEYICFLGEKDIPLSLVSAIFDDELDMDEAIALLRGYAFLSRRDDEESFDTHRLVRLAMRNWIKKQGKWEAWVTCGVQRLSVEFPDPEHENRTIWTRYLPHTETAVEFQDTCLDRKAALEFVFRISIAYRRQGHYEKEKQLLLLALEIQKLQPDPSNHQQVQMLRHLAHAYHHEGRRRESEDIISTALELAKTSLDSDDDELLNTMEEMANIHLTAGRYDESLELGKSVFNLTKERYGSDDPATILSMSNLTEMYRRRGLTQYAETTASEVLTIAKRVLDPTDPNLLKIMGDLATIYSDQGRYQEAESLRKEVLSTREAVQGLDHPDVLIAKNDLANSIFYQGRLAEAEDLYSRTVEAMKTKLGPNHTETINTMWNLGLLYREQKRLSEAEGCMTQAVQQWEVSLGSDHPDFLDTTSILATLYHNTERYDEAELLYNRVLAIYNTKRPLDHTKTFKTMSKLAHLYYDMGRYDEAEKLNKEIVEQWKEKEGSDHPETLKIMSSLGYTYYDMGRYDEAEKLDKEIVEQWKEKEGSDHPETLRSMSILGYTYYAMGRYDEAEKLDREIFEQWKEKEGPDHPQTLKSMSDLARSLRLQGNHEEALDLLKDCAGRRKIVLGADDPATREDLERIARWSEQDPEE